MTNTTRSLYFLPDTIRSAAIRAVALEVGGARLAWESGEGDAQLRGWELANGTEAIETNGDPLWSESTDGFAALWEAQGVLRSWRDVDVWSFRGRNEAECLDREGTEHVAALREYRDTGGMVDCYLVDPAEHDEDDDCTAEGPASDAIDWSGLDEAYAAIGGAS